MAAKAKPAGRVIVGGVNAREVAREASRRTAHGKIEKRRDDKFRLRLRGAFPIAAGDRLLVEADFETVLAVVLDVHAFGLVDVVVSGGLDEHANAVTVRRAPI